MTQISDEIADLACELDDRFDRGTEARLRGLLLQEGVPESHVDDRILQLMCEVRDEESNQ